MYRLYMNSCADLGGGTAGLCPPFGGYQKMKTIKRKKGKEERKRNERREKRKERSKENGKSCMYEKNILKTLSNKSIIVSVVQALIQGAAGLPTIFKKKKKKERNTKEKEWKEKRKGVMFYVNRASWALPCLALLAIPSKVGCSPPHVEAICFCPVPISTKLCPHMQSGRPAICAFVFPSSSFLSLVAIQ